MLIDNSLILDNAFTLTTTGSSTNYIDTIGAAGGQAQISGVNTIQGGGDAYISLWFEAIVIAAMTAGGTSLDVSLWTSDISAASIWTTGNATTSITAGSATVKMLGSGTIAAASLTKGAVLIKARLPVGLKRFLAAYYTCVGTFSGSGTLTTVLVPDVDINLT